MPRDCKPTDISPQDVLNLLLLKPPLDDQAPRPVNTARRTQFSEQELCNMLIRPFHPPADLSNVGEYGLLVPFPKTLWRRDLVASRATRQHIGVMVM